MADIKFSTVAGRLRRSEIRELLKLTRTPGTISFGGGLPNPDIFPIEPVEPRRRIDLDWADGKGWSWCIATRLPEP